METVGQAQPTDKGCPPGGAELRRVLEALPAGAYTCDAAGLITYFNGRAVELWGRKPKLNDPDDRYCGSFKLFTPGGSPIAHEECWMALALRQGKEYNGHEMLVERPDGGRSIALAHANPFRDDAGRIIGAVNVLVDITDRKRAEETLREADRNKNEFLAMLAHELRNPLAPIRNGLEIMQLSGTNAIVAAQARAMMERQLSHMVRLIDDLLDLSRITNGKIELRRERIDIAAAVRDALELSRPAIEGQDHKLLVKLPPEPVIVNADRTRLAQVFANLLNNSAKFTERGGNVRIGVECNDTDAVVRIADDGIGIAPEMLPLIFDMFIQIDRERFRAGLGIGLSLVRGLVELHGGTVEGHSQGLGKGSEFVVRLAVAIAPELQQGAPALDSDAPALSKYRILVVDDNQDSAISLAMMLRIIGHETQLAHDGIEAIDAAADFRPQVVLLDIGLPRLNGYETCRRMRDQAWCAATVLIAVTGWGNDDDKQRSKEAGFNYHMVKPVDPHALQKLLAGLLVTPT